MPARRWLLLLRCSVSHRSAERDAPLPQWNPDLDEYAAGGFPGARLDPERTRDVELVPDGAECRFGLELADDCAVTDVTPGGPAARAGITAGMELCHVNLEGVALKSDVLRSLAARRDAASPVIFGIYVPDGLAVAAAVDGPGDAEPGAAQGQGAPERSPRVGKPRSSDERG